MSSWVRSPPDWARTLAIVIPAWDGSRAVAAVVAEIPREASGMKLEVVVVVDGALDATASKAAGRGSLRYATYPSTAARHAALKLGYWLARARGAKAIATIDADGRYEPESSRAWSSRSSRTRPTSSQARGGSARAGDDRPRASPGRARVRRLDQRLVRHRITDPAYGIRAMRSEVTADVCSNNPYQASS